MSDTDYDDYDDGECWQCGGEGRVAGTCIDGCCAEQDDPYCEYCGAHPREARGGWQPERCTGECGLSFRDPDAEYEKMRDDHGWRTEDNAD